jgi:arylsulfatase A-like enzyme
MLVPETARVRATSRAALVLVGLVVGLSAVFIVAFSVRFGLPPWVIPAHLVLVTAGLVVTLLSVAAIQAVLPGWPRLALLPLALVIGGLVLVDAVNWVARGAWMEVISLRTMIAYAPRIYEVAAGATAVNGLWTLGVVLLMVALPPAVVLWYAPALAPAAGPHGSSPVGRRRSVRRVEVAFVLLTVACGAGYWTITGRSEVMGEPLIGLLSREQGRPASLGTTVADVPVVRAIGRGPASRVSAPDPISVVPGRKNVVIIVIDSLRPDHLSMFGYGRDTTPALDAFLAGRPMIVADWATSTCSISGCGILSLLGSAQFRRQGPGLTTLPQVLREAGYDTFFISSGDFTRGYPVLKQLFGATARMFVDAFSQPGAPGGGDDRGILAALASVPRYEGRPTFFYFHLHSVHKGGAKYREPTYHPSFSDTAMWAHLRTLLPAWAQGDKDAERRTTALLAEGEYDKAALAINDYDNSVLQADDVFARIIAELTLRGYLEQSVVVVTADHGEEFGEHGADGHGHDLHAESINVPLFIRDTTFSGSRRVPYARQVDVAPTILACVGLPIPPSWEGQALLSGPVASQSFHQTTHLQPIEAVVWRTTEGTYKYVFDTHTGAESLFEVDADPGEKTDVLRTAPGEVVSALRTALAANFGTTVPADCPTPAR